METFIEISRLVLQYKNRNIYSSEAFKKELKNCLDETGSFYSFIKKDSGEKLLRIWRNILNCFSIIKQVKGVFWKI